jgi:LmbE family N-acetylglucosaminyl deacetylase
VRPRHASAPAGSCGGHAATRSASRPCGTGTCRLNGQAKDILESLKRLPRPDLILTHERDDRHQDHRIACELTWNTFRDHTILEYEIPKYDGGLGQPNLYVPASRATARRKAELLLKGYPSQAGRKWFDAETFLSLMRVRGVECNAPQGYAEAFHARKVVW